jgi:hypothetical protein
MPVIVIVGVGDAEVAEQFELKGPNSQLRIAINDVVVIVGNSLLILNSEGHSRPQRKYHSSSLLDPLCVKCLCRVPSDQLTVYSLTNEDNMLVLVDVVVEINFVERISSVEQTSRSDGTNITKKTV